MTRIDELSNQSAALAQRIARKEAAREEWFKVISSQQLARAAKARVSKMSEWLPGTRVWYWRSHKGRKARSGSSTMVSSGTWRGPAVVLTHEKRASGELTGKVWVANCGYLIRVAPQHLRTMAVSEFLEYRISTGCEKSVDDFLKVVDELAKGQYEDLVGQGEPGPEDLEVMKEVFENTNR